MAKVRRAQTAEDLDAIMDLCSKVFSTYYQGMEHWKDLLRLDPGYSPEQSFFVMEQGHVVSNVRVTKRRVRVGEAAAILGGIADVVTEPAFRKKHYATACLQEAIRFMEDNGYHLSMLGTGIFDFYRRLGWEIALPRCSVHLNSKAACELPVEGYKVEVFRPEMLPQVMRLYEEENAARTCTVVRSRAYWRAQIQFSMKPPADGPMAFVKEHPEGFLVAFDSAGKAAGYARTKRPGHALSVHEAAATDFGAARALLGFIGRTAKDCGEIALDSPPDSRLARTALRELGAEQRVARSGDMMRIIRLLDLLKAMAPAFQRRLAASRFCESSGRLTVETDIVGRASLSWEKCKTEASESKRGGGKALDLRIPQSVLVQMVSGYKSGAAALEELGLARKLKQDQVEIVDTLFPAGFPFIHILDKF
jgi:predicted acetyltransferase